MNLSQHLVDFCRLLRHKGILIGLPEEIEACRVMELLPLDTPDNLYWGLRTALAKTPKEQTIFDEEFDTFWKIWNSQSLLKKTKPAEPPPLPQPKKPFLKKKQQNFVTIHDWLKQKQGEGEQEVAFYSANQVIGEKDFSLFYGMDLAEMENWIQLLGRSFAQRTGRRYQSSNTRGRIDLRRSLNKNLKRGTDIIQLIRKIKKPQKFRLVVLCDVSQSMDLYSRFVLQFLYAFQQRFQYIDTFVFSTSLHYVTPLLNSMDLNQALDQLAEAVETWSSGTQIGKCLQDYLEHYQDTTLTPQTLVLILSDGWDTGNGEGLENAMIHLQRKARSVIWLNPLKGNPSYEPTCQGMQTALPYIDYFGSAHNWQSMKDLANFVRALR